MRLIDSDKIPIKDFEQSVNIFDDDIVASVGLSWMKNVAEAQNTHMRFMIKQINDAPAIDAIPVVRGKWLEWNDGWFHGVKCTACNEMYCGEAEKLEHNFCPSCGAKMDSEET